MIGFLGTILVVAVVAAALLVTAVVGLARLAGMNGGDDGVESKS